jgi:uncharacterized protein YeaO (DUF488 family)
MGHRPLSARRVNLKRVYEPSAPEDGTRVLVDRLWPRGLSKADARIDLWLKDIAPSTGLRRWFAHDPNRWSEFRRRYQQELEQHAAELDQLRVIARQGKISLLYGARDEQHNDAVVLLEALLRLR